MLTGPACVKEIDVSTRTVRTVKPGLPIHALVISAEKEVVIVMENHGAILDFSKIEVNNIDDSVLFSYAFKQQTELVPRSSFLVDPIVKTVVVVLEDDDDPDLFGKIHAIAIRESGAFDFYMDKFRIESHI